MCWIITLRSSPQRHTTQPPTRSCLPLRGISRRLFSDRSIILVVSDTERDAVLPSDRRGRHAARFGLRLPDQPPAHELAAGSAPVRLGPLRLLCLLGGLSRGCRRSYGRHGRAPQPFLPSHLPHRALSTAATTAAAAGSIHGPERRDPAQHRGHPRRAESAERDSENWRRRLPKVADLHRRQHVLSRRLGHSGARPLPHHPHPSSRHGLPPPWRGARQLLHPCGLASRTSRCATLSYVASCSLRIHFVGKQC